MSRKRDRDGDTPDAGLRAAEAADDPLARGEYRRALDLLGDEGVQRRLESEPGRLAERTVGAILSEAGDIRRLARWGEIVARSIAAVASRGDVRSARDAIDAALEVLPPMGRAIEARALELCGG